MRNLWITCPPNPLRRTGSQQADGQKPRAKTRMDAGKSAPVPSTPSSGGCRRGRNFRGRAWRVGPGAREVPAPAGFRFSPLRPGAVQARLTASFGSAHSGPAWPGSPRMGSAWFGLASPKPVPPVPVSARPGLVHPASARSSPARLAPVRSAPAPCGQAHSGALRRIPNRPVPRRLVACIWFHDFDDFLVNMAASPVNAALAAINSGVICG